VHVCQRWRGVVFASSLRLHLQVLCTARRPVQRLLHVWPTLPLAIRDHSLYEQRRPHVDNIIAALEHHDRVRHIELWGVSNAHLGRFAAVTQEPFPELTFLELLSDGRGAAPVLPDSLFGGFAPRLHTVHLKAIPFPPVRALLLSATDLVDLDLWNMPYFGFVSAEETVNCLVAMTGLKSLFLGFHSPLSRPDPANQHPPPPIRTELPALTQFKYRGVSETLEDLVARIDVPLLENAEITFFNQLLFDSSRLPQFIAFIGRINKFKVFDQACVLFQPRYGQVRLSQEGTVDHATLKLKIACKASDWQISSLSQVCDRSWLPYTVERLDLREDPDLKSHWKDDMENGQWKELLDPFTDVKDLYLSKELALRIAPTLQELVWPTEVLPVLQNIFLAEPEPSGDARDAISPFIVARQLSNYPVTVHYWREGKWVLHAPGGR
jgi:hypothetical protein